MNEGAFMTKCEINRVEIFALVKQKGMSQVKAAQTLNLSIRHTQRLYKIYQNKGPTGLVSKQRGRESNRQLNKFLKARIIELIGMDLYQGFGPTYMTEILERNHQIVVSRETIRKIMTHQGLWKSKKEKSPVVHQQRQRRARCGELIQIDGSPHAWFEERGEKCTLIVFIDDATGRTYGKFFLTETTSAYLETIYEYIKKYGKPEAMYSDRHNIFKVNKPGCLRKENITQFGRALKELDIRLHWANSPQAKGRVERVNKTLQDRLVKELRLQGIQDIEAANRYLEEKYWESHNSRFEKKAKNPEDAHRTKPSTEELKQALSEKYTGKVSKNMEFQFESTVYQIKEDPKGLIRAQITIIRGLDGKIEAVHKGKHLHIEEYNKQTAGGVDSDSKQIAFALGGSQTQRAKPSKYHPWNQEARGRFRMKRYAQM